MLTERTRPYTPTGMESVTGFIRPPAVRMAALQVERTALPGHGGSCPHGYHGCCPIVRSGPGSGLVSEAPLHYSYSVPSNLTYPQQMPWAGRLSTRTTRTRAERLLPSEVALWLPEKCAKTTRFRDTRDRVFSLGVSREFSRGRQCNLHIPQSSPSFAIFCLVFLFLSPCLEVVFSDLLPKTQSGVVLRLRIPFQRNRPCSLGFVVALISFPS